MRNKVVILGAGVVGRFAKLMLGEDAVCYDRKSPTATDYTCRYLGGNISRVMVPELKCTPGILESTINGQKPTMDLIRMYKELKTGSTDLDFGDVKQFLPIQPVFFVDLPEVEVQYGYDVKEIDIINKTILFTNGESIVYNSIINTIPLNSLVSKILLYQGIITDKFLVRNKPIYYREEQGGMPKLPENHILLDYKADDTQIYYREMFTNTKRSVESNFNFQGAVPILPGKLLNSKYSEELSKDLQLYGIYCYGRYARWRTKEHIHETFKNLRRFKERFGQIGYC